MSPTITALQADPLDPDKVHVFVDGEHAIAIALDVAASEKLSVGQACPPERLERLHAAQEMQNVFEAALNFLSYRPRSAREVELRLKKKRYEPHQIAEALERLRQRGYVDDLAFARFWVSNRMAFSPRGPRLLRSELRQKGVAQEIVDRVMSERSEEQAERREEAEAIAEEHGSRQEEEPAPGSDEAIALSLARKRMRLLGGLDRQTARRRLSGFLARRGYNYDTIDAVIRRVLAQEEDAAQDC